MHGTPSHLLYLLTVGREKELALQLHDEGPTEDEIVSWMKAGAVVRLTASSQGEVEAFGLVVNFGHVVAARIAPYSASRSASF
jgi:hypothetical protein